MGNFYSFLKKKINNDPININNNQFLKNNDAKIDIYTNEDDNKDLPAYSQVSHLCLII
jgi:hypothetical protein|uniref:Uncharacterized protein n=1 Tax=viral metagenome TaxID=1070528 RepID=A0A6C0DXD2_9ZZZZ